METWQVVLFQMMNGLIWGLILALLALGLTLIYGLLDIINVAHGSLYMMGAVVGWYILAATASFWLALILSPVLVAGFGILVERTVLRRIEPWPVLTIISTIGLMFVLQDSALMIFGGTPQRIREPWGFIVPIFGMGYSGYRLIVAALSCATLGAGWLFLSRAKYGIWMRAVRQNRELAVSLGIPAHRVYMFTFGIGSGLAALGGVLAAPIAVVDHMMGVEVLLMVFLVVIVGGLGSLKGCVVAAILLSELEGVGSAFVSPVVARTLSLVVMATVLLIRPEGLLQARPD